VQVKGNGKQLLEMFVILGVTPCRLVNDVCSYMDIILGVSTWE